MEKVAKEILDQQFETQTEKSSLSSQQGDFIVVYFYPKDNTPGCSNEAEDFKDHFDEFEKHSCSIVGVSRDSKKSHENFAEKFKLQFPLFADTDEVLCKAFDVIKEKNMFGKVGLGIERSTFLIDKSGQVLQEWRKVKVPGHVSEVLEFVKAFK